MSTKKHKNPFIGFTLDEAEDVESTCFTIHVGTDFFSHGDQFVFDKRSCNKHLKKIAKNLINTINTGSRKQRMLAMEALSTLHARPFRIQ